MCETQLVREKEWNSLEDSKKKEPALARESNAWAKTKSEPGSN